MNTYIDEPFDSEGIELLELVFVMMKNIYMLK